MRARDLVLNPTAKGQPGERPWRARVTIRAHTSHFGHKEGTGDGNGEGETCLLRYGRHLDVSGRGRRVSENENPDGYVGENRVGRFLDGKTMAPVGNNGNPGWENQRHVRKRLMHDDPGASGEEGECGVMDRQ